MDARKESRREEARKTAAELIRSTTDNVVREILDDEDGPMEYTREQGTSFTNHLHELVEQRDRQRQARISTEHRRDGIMELQVAGEKLAGTSSERVSR